MEYRVCALTRLGRFVIPLNNVEIETPDEGFDLLRQMRADAERANVVRNYDLCVAVKRAGRYHVLPEGDAEPPLSPEERAIIAQEEAAYAKRTNATDWGEDR